MPKGTKVTTVPDASSARVSSTITSTPVQITQQMLQLKIEEKHVNR